MKTTFQTKVFGPIALIQGFVPSMRKKRHGLLITTSSIFCTLPFIPQGFSAYISALCAFERIQESLAVELAPWNIKVINFQPGPIRTSLSRFFGSKAKVTKDYYQGFWEKAYDWFQKNTPYQTVAEVAKIYVEIIEMKNPNFTYQSNSFGKEFVEKSRLDPSGQSYLNEWLDYFSSNEETNPKDWHIKK